MLTEKKKRVDWDEYFMDIAQVVSSRSTCDRKFVGAVIVRDKTILSTGYNGSIRKLEHCDEVGHLMDNGHCVATIHAEANAILQAAKNGVRIDEGTIYTTASPCWTCFKLIANAGLKRICYGEFYRDDRIFHVAKKIKIELVKLGSSGEEDLASGRNGNKSDIDQYIKRIFAETFAEEKSESKEANLLELFRSKGLDQGRHFTKTGNDFKINLPHKKGYILVEMKNNKSKDLHYKGIKLAYEPANHGKSDTKRSLELTNTEHLKKVISDITALWRQ